MVIELKSFEALDNPAHFKMSSRVQPLFSMAEAAAALKLWCKIMTSTFQSLKIQLSLVSVSAILTQLFYPQVHLGVRCS